MGSGVLLASGWLTFLLLLGITGLPLAAKLFPERPALGAPFALPLSLAVVTLLTYWIGRFNFPLAPLVAVILMAGTTVALTRRWRSPLPLEAYVESAIVFSAGFVFVVLIVMVAPAVTANGETFWNFGLIQSLHRTGRLPPMDPWFAGEPVRYYYGGHLIVATIAELTNTSGRFAYNLGLAVVYGSLVTAAYGVAGAIGGVRELPRRTTGILGAFYVGLASNLYPPVKATLAVLPASIARPLATGLSIDPAAVSGPVSFSILDAAHFSFTNTDFPLYSVFVHGLHPHFMSPPFLLLLCGVLFGYYRTPEESRRRRLGLLAGTTSIVGLIALINTWSLPTAAGLVALTAVLAPAHPLTLIRSTPRPADRRRRWSVISRVAGGLFLGVGGGVIGMLWVVPYFLRGLAGNPGIGLVTARSGPAFFVLAYGGFLLAFGGYLLLEGRTAEWTATRTRLALVTGLLLISIGWLADRPGIVIVGPVFVAGLALHANGRGTFATVLMVAGAGLALLIELVHVVESAEPGRINTVYKVYSQIWVLWGIAAAVIAAHLYHGGFRSQTGLRWRRALAVLLVVGLSGYAVAGVGGTADLAIRYDVRPSLDGLAYLQTVHPDYAAAIGWLASHPGQPTIVSAPVPEDRLYQFNASPAASLTGIPTLVGWNHQADYRGEAVYRERVQAVDTIYSGLPADRSRLLRDYHVTFIWVGEAERSRYHPIDYSREPGITTAFQEGNITIYRVNRSRLEVG